MLLPVQYLMAERVFLLLGVPWAGVAAVITSSCASAVSEDFAWKLSLSWVTPDVVAEGAGGNALLWLRGQKQQEEPNRTVAHKSLIW